jgi:hypothetical protein
MNNAQLADLEINLDGYCGQWAGLWVVQQFMSGTWVNMFASASSDAAVDNCVILAASHCDQNNISYAQSLRNFRLVTAFAPTDRA